MWRVSYLRTECARLLQMIEDARQDSVLDEEGRAYLIDAALTLIKVADALALAEPHQSERN